MYFTVWISGGKVVYEGSSWPMARAALDHIMLEDKGCPFLVTYPDSESETKE